MKLYLLYGIQTLTLEEAGAQIEDALGVRFEPRESGYRGGAYLSLRDDKRYGEHLSIQRNFDDFENEWQEETHQEWPFLLYASEVVDEALLDLRMSLLPSVKKLSRHEVVPRR